MLKKIEMSSCDGTNTSDWLVDVEHFFDIGRFYEEEKLNLVPLYLEGRVKKWFAWLRRRGDFRNWLDFTQRLLVHFAESIDDEASTRLFAIRQTGTVADYVSEFEVLSSQVLGVEDRFLERIFYNGLCPEMKEVIKMKEPQGLQQYIAVVLKMEKSAFCKVISGVAVEEKKFVVARTDQKNRTGTFVNNQRGHNE